VLSTAARHRRPSRPQIELADVFRRCTDWIPRLDGQQARVVRAILRCRTAALGGHIQHCDSCGHSEIHYNSCRNRHCPKCQGSQQFRWIEAQQRHLLPVEYHHVVFTIPDRLHTILRAHPRRAYGLLFAAVAETLQEVARNPKNLGAKIGFSCVLHTWTQTLLYHPHIHCIVTGGGLHPDGDRWVAAKPGFLFPVRILSRLFRAKLLHKLELNLKNGSLRTFEPDPRARLRAAARKDWVVYSKPPFAGPEQVLRYLGRYTHRVAISNHRLVALDGSRVTFSWKDRAHGDATRLLTLDVGEFLRRFLLHLVPAGMMRIRHYGLLANPTRRRLLERSRLALANQATSRPDTSQPPRSATAEEDPHRCPRCENGRLLIIAVVLPGRRHATPTPSTRVRAP